MKTAKRKRLERAGWRLASIEEFLEVSEEERVLVEIKLTLADAERAKLGSREWPSLKLTILG